MSAIQLLYVVKISNKVKQRSFFQNFGLNIQYCFTELAILVFLIVLCIFAFSQNTSFSQSRAYSALQTIVVVTVYITISA